MNDVQLERNLRSIGKECFVTYFWRFHNLSVPNQEVALQLQEERGHTWNACQSRTSTARSIIGAGRAKHAMMSISESERVEYRIRDEARRIAFRMR